jgi:polysaccharide export outer membrane protein
MKIAMHKTVALALCVTALSGMPRLLHAAAEPVEITVSDPAKAGDSVEAALSDSVAAPTEADTFKKPKLQPVADKRAGPRRAVSADVSGQDAGAESAAPLPPANPGSFTLRAGDVLQVTVWREENLDREVIVLPDGSISFPLIGSVQADGLTPAQLQAAIKTRLRSLIPGASVAVLVKAALGHTVNVIGQVQKPGEIIMSHALSVMQALSQAGGLTPYAAEGRIIVLRTVEGKQVSIPFPYDDVVDGDDLEQNFTLLPGDVVVVPTASLF